MSATEAAEFASLLQRALVESQNVLIVADRAGMSSDTAELDAVHARLEKARAAVLAAYDAAKRARERVELARGVAMIDLTRTTRERDALAETVERVKAFRDSCRKYSVNLAHDLDAALAPPKETP